MLRGVIAGQTTCSWLRSQYISPDGTGLKGTPHHLPSLSRAAGPDDYLTTVRVVTVVVEVYPLVLGFIHQAVQDFPDFL